MADDDVVPIGIVENDAGDVVRVGLQSAKVHLEVENPGREPVEVWLSAGEATSLAALVRRAAGAD